MSIKVLLFVLLSCLISLSVSADDSDLVIISEPEQTPATLQESAEISEVEPVEIEVPLEAGKSSKTTKKIKKFFDKISLPPSDTAEILTQVDEVLAKNLNARGWVIRGPQITSSLGFNQKWLAEFAAKKAWTRLQNFASKIPQRGQFVLIFGFGVSVMRVVPENGKAYWKIRLFTEFEKLKNFLSYGGEIMFGANITKVHETEKQNSLRKQNFNNTYLSAARIATNPEHISMGMGFNLAFPPYLPLLKGYTTDGTRINWVSLKIPIFEFRRYLFARPACFNLY